MSIDYDITPQRQAYLEARGYTILTACPGSGKIKTFNGVTLL